MKWGVIFPQKRYVSFCYTSSGPPGQFETLASSVVLPEPSFFRGNTAQGN